MTNLEEKGSGTKIMEKYNSTSYSNNITCGICGASVRNIPVMYEKIGIDWRCAKCLRRDKPTLENHAG